MKAIERLFEYLDFKGIPHTRFEKTIGLSNGYLNTMLKRKADLGEGVLNKIIDNCLDLRTEWLLVGKGKMLLSDMSIVNEPMPQYGNDLNKPHLIPLLPVEAIAGFGSGDWSITEADIQEKYMVPDFNHIDFMVTVKGSSMYPKYNSGDIVVCRKIKEKSFIQWNKAYVIATREQGILVKRIKQGENDDHYLMVSDNSEFPPYNVPKSEITGLAIVIGTIRLE